MRPSERAGAGRGRIVSHAWEARLEAFSSCNSCKARATALGGLVQGPGSPDTSRRRRLAPPGLTRRLRPSPRALPALIPWDCCKGRHRNNTGFAPPTCSCCLHFPGSGPLKRFKSTAARKGAKAH